MQKDAPHHDDGDSKCVFYKCAMVLVHNSLGINGDYLGTCRYLMIYTIKEVRTCLARTIKTKQSSWVYTIYIYHSTQVPCAEGLFALAGPIPLSPPANLVLPAM